MKYPATIDELEAAGYGYTGTGKMCACGVQMLWFITPNRAWMPFSAVDESKLTPHHIICVDRKNFRRAEKEYKKRTDPPMPKQGKLF